MSCKNAEFECFVTICWRTIVYAEAVMEAQREGDTMAREAANAKLWAMVGALGDIENATGYRARSFLDQFSSECEPGEGKIIPGPWIKTPPECARLVDAIEN